MWKFEVDGTTIAVSKNPLVLVDSAKEILSKRLQSNALTLQGDWKYVSGRFYAKFIETYVEGQDEFNAKVSRVIEIQ